jgi:hypothetical protein
LQVDYVAWHQSSEDELNPATREPLNESRFVIPRSRLRGDFEHTWFSGTIEIDGNTVNGPMARLLDAEARFVWRNPEPGAPPYVLVSAGSMKVPFGMEVPESERDNVFNERTNAANALFPGNFDLGARVEGAYGFGRAVVAAMNGSPVGSRFFPGEDPNRSRDVLGRLGVELEVTRGLSVRAGASALWGQGFHAGTPPTKDVLVWRDANENSIVEPSEVQVIPATSGTASENFERFAVGGDLRLGVDVPLLGRLNLIAELVRAQNLDRGENPADPVAAGRDLREWGGHLAITQALTRYAIVGARCDRYDPDADASDQLPFELVPADRTLSTWSFNVTGGYPPYGQLTAQLDLNRNPFGRDASGRPATLPDNRFTLRAEVGF